MNNEKKKRIKILCKLSQRVNFNQVDISSYNFNLILIRVARVEVHEEPKTKEIVQLQVRRVSIKGNLLTFIFCIV